MSDWLKNKYFWTICIVGLGLAYYALSSNGSRLTKGGWTVPEPIAPVTRESGTVDYTLIAWIFPNKKQFEHWVLRFPDDVVITRPEDLKNRGPVIVNGIKFGAGRRSNSALTAYLYLPKGTFIRIKGQNLFHPDVARISVNASHQVYKKASYNSSGAIETGFAGRYKRLNCAREKQIAEGFFQMRDETAQEKQAHGPSYKSYLKNRCGPSRDLVNFAYFDDADDLLAKGECHISDLYKSKHTSCNFRIWLPQQRDAYVSISPKYLPQFPSVYRKIVDTLNDATVIEHSVNLPWRPRDKSLARAKFGDDAAGSSDQPAADGPRSKTKTEHVDRTPDDLRIAAPGCDIPKVGKTDKLILLGVYGGSALSNVTILGQDKETKAAELSIEQGTEPLYIVITSHAGMIWNIVGATDRISRIVLSSFTGSHLDIVASGVTGVDSSRVSFFTGGNRCIPYFSSPDSPKAVQATGSLRAMAGRDPDQVLGIGEIGFASLPNGPVEMLTRLHRPSIIDAQLLRFSPSGVMRFKPGDVVSEIPAKLYEVLPQEAGLVQLIREGKIERMDRGFRINTKIRFPAGLNGAHRVRFVLSRGVPDPDGNPGHSCVFTDGGRRLAGSSSCR